MIFLSFDLCSRWQDANLRWPDREDDISRFCWQFGEGEAQNPRTLGWGLVFSDRWLLRCFLRVGSVFSAPTVMCCAHLERPRFSRQQMCRLVCSIELPQPFVPARSQLYTSINPPVQSNAHLDRALSGRHRSLQVGHRDLPPSTLRTSTGVRAAVPHVCCCPPP